MKKLLITLFALAFILPLGAENRAYRALQESPLYLLDEKGNLKETLPLTVAKGDTVYATQETHDFINEYKGEGKNRIPVEYQGTNAFIYLKNIHPIKLDSTDILEYVDDHVVEPGSFKEQKIIPLMEWAMNVTPNPLMWLYVALIALACGVGFRFLSGMKGFGMIGLSLVGVSLAVMSASEIMYFLSYEQHSTWFLKSGIVGGWGRVILNFFILAAVCAGQGYLFYDLWKSSFTVGDQLSLSFRKKDEYDDDWDEEEENETPKWLTYAAYLPVAIGLLLIIFVIAKASATAYLVMGATIVAAALAGAFFQISKGRIVQGIIFPLCYIVASVGLTVMVMTLSVIMLLVAIVGVLLILAVMFAWSFLTGLIGDRVDFVDEYGRKHTGTRKLDGTVKGDDGKTYTLDD